MAWSERLEGASFRSVAFDVIGTTDGRSKSLAKYQRPYSNNSRVEDMGADTPSHKIQALIEGTDYETTLQALCIALDKSGAGELVHPVFGRLMVVVDRYEVKHSPDLVDGCLIDIDFVAEQSQTENQALFVPTPKPAQSPYIKVMAQPSVRLLQLQAQVEYFPQPLTLSDIADKVRSGIRTATRTLNTLQKTANDLLSPPTWIGGIMSDVSGLTRAIFDPNFSAIAEWRSLAKRFALLDDVFSRDDDPEPLRHVGRTLRVAALVTAVQELVSAETVQPTMTHADLISVRNEVRDVIQGAIALERAAALQTQADQSVSQTPPIPLDTNGQVAALKQVADTVTQQINVLINARPSLTNYTVRQPANLRLLAHRLYGDHRRASELLRLNPALVNPALIDVGTVVQAYVQ